MIGAALPEPVPGAPPFPEVHDAVNDVMALPLFAPGVNATEADALPLSTLPIVGALGTVAGTNAADAAEGALVPLPFVAVTLHVYVLPLVRPVTTMGADGPDRLPGAPPLLDRQEAVDEVTGLPLSAPGVNATDPETLPRVTAPIVGACGTVDGIAVADAIDDGPVPSALVALTVHEYVLAFVRPVTVLGEPGPMWEPEVPPSFELHAAVYEVIGLPPSLAAPNETTICALPAVTNGCGGCSGTAAGTTTSDASDGGLSPIALLAVTVQV